MEGMHTPLALNYFSSLWNTRW